jgi:hypothetical protein
MSFFYRQLTFNVPGVYQWIKPPIAAGAGPFGSTYLETIVTVIGPGSGGSGGGLICNTTGATGGPGGNAGAYAQATYLPAALLALEDIIVGAGTPGGAARVAAGTATTSQIGIHSNSATLSKFGVHITSQGGEESDLNSTPATASVTGGSNVTNVSGGVNIQVAPGSGSQPNISQSVRAPGNLATYSIQGNSAGGNGGERIGITTPSAGGNGGGILLGGGIGTTNADVAGNGLLPSAGGGACVSNIAGLFPLQSGNGQNGIPNTGAGGGGGGLVCSQGVIAGGLMTSGFGGQGSNGRVQVIDIFTLPPQLPPYVFDLEIIAWYHMFNMARPISLTGRYKS